MLQTKYFVSHDGQQQGPFTVVEINAKIKSHELNVSDYVYDEIAADWFMIVAYHAFSDLVQFSKPVQPPKTEVKKPASEVPEWFILKGQNRFGPYSFYDVVKLLQTRSLFEYDYAWNPNLETWHLISDLEDFKAEKIRALKSSAFPELTEVFFRRRHSRTNYNASLIVHNNSKVWKGKSFEISPGGAGIELESGLLQVSQSVSIHFKPGDDVPPFNAKCEVVSVRTTGKDKEKKVIYGIKFLELAQQAQEYLAQYAEKNVRAS